MACASRGGALLHTTPPQLHFSTRGHSLCSSSRSICSSSSKPLHTHAAAHASCSTQLCSTTSRTRRLYSRLRSSGGSGSNMRRDLRNKQTADGGTNKHAGCKNGPFLLTNAGFSA